MQSLSLSTYCFVPVASSELLLPFAVSSVAEFLAGSCEPTDVQGSNTFDYNGNSCLASGVACYTSPSGLQLQLLPSGARLDYNDL